VEKKYQMGVGGTSRYVTTQNVPSYKPGSGPGTGPVIIDIGDSSDTMLGDLIETKNLGIVGYVFPI
jgi:hypothetical protein